MFDWLVTTIDWTKSIIALNITGLLGVYIGARLYGRQMSIERRLGFYEKQLRELYSPLLGVRKEIQILSEFRLEGEQAEDKWWRAVCRIGDNIGDKSEATKYYNQESQHFKNQTGYENKQLVDKIIPSYRKMVEIFKNNYWLANEETKQYFPTLIKFVETWERHLSGTHHPEVLSQISVSEEKLPPFYNHLVEFHDILRAKLKEGRI